MIGHFDIIKEMRADSDALRSCRADSSNHDLVLEGPEDNHAEFDVDVDQAITMSDQTFRCKEQIVETDTEADLLDDFVGVFGVDVVFNGLCGWLVEVFWFDLHKIRNFSL